MAFLSTLLLLIVAACIAYLYLLLVASIRVPNTQPAPRPHNKIAIAIPAHNEEGVIGQTVERLLQTDYPRELFQVFVAADHCTDCTAEVARQAGARSEVRDDGPRGGKAAAVSWLLARIGESDFDPDAVIIFDGDTLVDKAFLRIMDARLSQGDVAIQGAHAIVNAGDNALTGLLAAMFIVDNRIQNLGRSNLGWSAKNMGDSICLRTDVLRRLGWGEGLTEDYELRQRLLLAGITIRYEPKARAYGEAAATLRAAKTQRERWLSGTYRASSQHRWTMLSEGLGRRDTALIDGALQASLPSYSTLAVIAGVALALHLLLAGQPGAWLTAGWGVALLLLAIYPFAGLVLDGAPRWAYTALLVGPLFIVVRTVISVMVRVRRGQGEWIRTPRRAASQTTHINDEFQRQ